MWACVVAIPAVAAGPHALLRKLPSGGKQRQRLGLDDRADSAPRGELVDVAEEPEAGDVDAIAASSEPGGAIPSRSA